MKKYFITGLVILLPLAVTIAIVVFIVNFLTGPFVDAVSHILGRLGWFKNGFLFLNSEQLIRYGSKFLILLAIFGFTILLGVITRWLFINTLLMLGDKLLHRIPIINTVYKTSQDIIKTLFVSDKNSFKQVVMVEFPRAGVYSIGLIARESPPVCCEKTGKKLISVLVPTTPNPTTGFLIMLKQEEIHYIDMRPEEAIKYVVSCGVIIPTAKAPTTLPPSQ